MIASPKINLSRSLRLSPLAACLAVVFAGPAAAYGSLTSSTHAVAAHANAGAMVRRVANPMPFNDNRPVGPNLLASTKTVTSCNDDTDPGTLRNVIAAAGEGDTIDLSTLACTASKITLTQGQISTALSNLTLQGPTSTPAGPALSIDAGSTSRVLYASATGSGTLTINGLSLVNGTIDIPDGYANGGCVFDKHALVLTNSAVSNCNASGGYVFGGAISAFGAVTLTNSVVSNSTATAGSTATGMENIIQAAGGGIYSGGNVSLTGSTLSSNAAVIGDDLSGTSQYSFILGGAVDMTPFSTGATSMAIVSSTLSGNYSQRSGGAVHVEAYSAAQTLTVTNSTFTGNYAYYFGGAIQANKGAVVVVQNSTLSGNSGNLGGAIEGYYATSLTVQNSTIAFNAAVNAGGIYASSYANTLNSTIVANNTVAGTAHAADIGSGAATTISGANNLVIASDTTVTFTNPPLTSDPKLLPLANNGGPTQTNALDPTSPAKDMGNNAGMFANDQRGAGYARTSGVATDIGAYEIQDITDRIFANGFETM